MIIYFSATGNSKYVAEKIAKTLNDKAVSITSIKEKEIEVSDEYFGIVTPTCFWSMPKIVSDFINDTNFKINDSTYCFAVATYGSFTGTIGNDLQKKLRIKNVNIKAKYSVKMPDIWTPFFNLTDTNKNNDLLDKAEEKTDCIINLIKDKKCGNYMNNKLPRIVTLLFKPMYNSFRKTKNFKVNSKCISCGLCESKCPCKAIKLINGKPMWIESECTLCLGCMHRCPRFAIEYRKNAKKHGQYTNPNTKI